MADTISFYLNCSHATGEMLTFLEKSSLPDNVKDEIRKIVRREDTGPKQMIGGQATNG